MVNKNPKACALIDELVFDTLRICGKMENHCPRFPRWAYPNFVDRIINLTLDIQDLVISSNENQDGPRKEEKLRLAAEKCVVLIHLVRISYGRGYISRKQYESWSKDITDLRNEIISWLSL